MKIALFILVLLGSLCACAGTPLREDTELPSIDEFKQDLTAANVRLWGSLSRYKYKNDLSTLDFEHYRKYLGELSGNQTERLLSSVKSLSPGAFKATKNDFYVCFRSERLIFVLCDRASTVGIDMISREAPLKSVSAMMEALEANTIVKPSID